MEQESNEQEPNEATEIVGGKVETVEVSRHPEASIPETDLSLADIERRRSHPLRWALIILAVLCAIIAPYWFGRSLAVNNTDSIVAVLGLACEQFIAGLSMLNLNFWYSTYVVYGKQAGLANAANLGIMGAAIGIAVYALVFVGLLVIIRKTSPLNVLTKSWASFILYFVIETIALLVVLFGGLLTTV